jgi:hypothetical protein
MRKCEGTPSEKYPGLLFESDVVSQPPCAVTSSSGATHRLKVTNLSLLTYTVQFTSECQKEYLHYVNPRMAHEDPNVWLGNFTAPLRWDSRGRDTTIEAEITGVDGASQTNCEVNVELTCQSGNYALVGPFRIVLQVDVTDSGN